MNSKKVIKGILLVLFIIGVLLFIIFPSRVNAAVNVTRNVYSNDGSMKFNFTGLTLDVSHEYQFGFTSTVAAEVTNWYDILVYTDSTATVDILSGTTQMRKIIQTTDKGYITIKDKTTDTIVLQPYAVDLKMPYLQVTNYTVIPNGKELDKSHIEVPLRNTSNSEAYYQYEKITDTNVINKYKEIKAKNGDYEQLQSILKTTVPKSNWSNWARWSVWSLGDDYAAGNGSGYTEKTVKVPDTGLYYMWLYFAGSNVKPLYGYILVDNLEEDIALDSISLPKTATVELGKTLTLSPTFNPTNATNKIVTWKSSDESVATIDNGGKITPKKIGSTIITVTSQDGNKKATCTVTVTEVQSSTNTGTNNNQGTNNNGSQSTNTGTNNNQGTNNNGNQGTNTGTTNNGSQGTKPTTTNNSSTQNGKDTTTAPVTKIPQAGASYAIVIVLAAVVGVGIVLFFKYRRMRDII